MSKRHRVCLEIILFFNGECLGQNEAYIFLKLQFTRTVYYYHDSIVIRNYI